MRGLRQIIYGSDTPPPVPGQYAREEIESWDAAYEAQTSEDGIEDWDETPPPVQEAFAREEIEDWEPEYVSIPEPEVLRPVPPLEERFPVEDDNSEKDIHQQETPSSKPHGKGSFYMGRVGAGIKFAVLGETAHKKLPPPLSSEDFSTDQIHSYLFWSLMLGKTPLRNGRPIPLQGESIEHIGAVSLNINRHLAKYYDFSSNLAADLYLSEYRAILTYVTAGKGGIRLVSWLKGKHAQGICGWFNVQSNSTFSLRGITANGIKSYLGMSAPSQVTLTVDGLKDGHSLDAGNRYGIELIISNISEENKKKISQSFSRAQATGVADMLSYYNHLGISPMYALDDFNLQN